MTEILTPTILTPTTDPTAQVDDAAEGTAARTADRALKAKHRALWALGNYPAVAAEVIAPLGRVLVDACQISVKDEVLDVAAGSGNAAIPAAATGASVVASDLTPELLEVGRSTAGGMAIDWQVADAEALPFTDGRFDVVMSCVGVMFAPHHQVAADELVRVCRPGGRIGLINWTPTGFVGEMFSAMKPYAPPPPPGALPGPLWGTEAHVRTLFGERVSDLVAQTRSVAVDRFADGAEFRDFFKKHYGPTVSTYRFIAADPDRVAALDDALAALGDRHLAGRSTMAWEYLLVTATVK